MKSYTLDISKSIRSGLRPSEFIRGNGRFLSAAENVQPFTDRLVSAAKVSRFTALNEDAEVFAYAVDTFVLTGARLYKVDKLDGSLVELLNNLPSGGRWFGADFGYYVVFGNGACYLIRNPVTGEFSIDLGTVMPLAGALTRFRGRLILGNIKTGEFRGRSSLMWSDIGEASFIKSGALDTNRKNTSGQEFLYDIEEIYSIVPYEDKHFIVYGSDGVCIVTPRPSEHAAGAMAKKYISRIGVASQYAAIGTNRGNYHITSLGTLRQIFYKQGALSDEDLDFREFIDTTARLSWDKLKETLVIGIPPTSPFSAGKSYLLNKYGMGEMSSYIQTIATRGTSEYIHAPANIKQLDAMFTTDVLDFDSPGFKTIGFIELLGKLPDSVYIAASYRADRADNWLSTDWIRVNQFGVAYLNVAAIEFRLHVAILDYTEFDISSIKPTVSFDDRRFTVGMRGAKHGTGGEADSGADS